MDKDDSTEPSPPTTPRKRPKFSSDINNTGRRVKSITKVTEKESATMICPILVAVWALILLGVALTLQAKVKAAESTAAS